MGDGGGFTLGLAFDGSRALYVCDSQHAAVYRLDLKSRGVERFSGTGIKIPNYPVVDAVRGRLLVSDSHHFAEPGPGVWAYDLATGEGGLWYDKPLRFANGMALSLDGSALYVCETFARRITRIAILADGSAGVAAPSRSTCRAFRTASPSTTAARSSSAATSPRASSASRRTGRRWRSTSRSRRRISSPIRPTSPSTARRSTPPISAAGTSPNRQRHDRHAALAAGAEATPQ